MEWPGNFTDRFVLLFRNQKVPDVTSSLNTKMVEFWENPAVVIAQPKWIHGGVGYSGIAAIACAFATNKDQNQIVILVCVKQHRTSLPTGK